MELNAEKEVLFMARTKITQCQEILDYIEKHGSISPKEADKAFGCMRLASRISDLKRKGYTFSVQMEKGKNKAGKTTRYARYRLGGLDE